MTRRAAFSIMITSALPPVAAPLPDLATAINNAIAPIYHTQIALVAYPAQGDFPWWYQNPNGVFNQSTFDYVSARVSPSGTLGTVRLSPSGGFPNAYMQVVNDLIYTLSSADLDTLSRAQGAASAEVATMVNDYQTAFGAITLSQMNNASVSTKEDYIVSYIMGALWSGRSAARQPPLTYCEMAAAPNLLALMRAMPAAGNQVVNDALAYLQSMAPANALLSQVQLGAWLIAQLRANTSAPSLANGGIQTVDPDSGAVSTTFQVGYAINRAIGDIQRDLNDANRVLRVVVAAPTGLASAPRTAQAEAPSMVRFVRMDGLAVDVAPAAGVGPPSSVTVEYPGYTMVPVSSAAWQQARNSGWFYADPIAEAAANGSSDVTGFKFATVPAYNLGGLAAGGNLGQLTGLLISNYPTVTMPTPPQTAFATLARVGAQGTSGALSLFGLRLGDPSRVTYCPTYTSARDTAQVVKFTPSVTQVSDLAQTAYVIGATVNFPATPSSNR